MRFEVILSLLATATIAVAQSSSSPDDPTEKDHTRHNCCVQPTSGSVWIVDDSLTRTVCDRDFSSKAMYFDPGVCTEQTGVQISGDDFYNSCRKYGAGLGFYAVGAGYRHTC